MLQQLFPNDAFSLLLVFARIGSAVMLLPGFGESYVAPRIRLIFAVALSVVMAPLVAQTLPRLPGAPIALFVLLGGEILIGLFIGGLVRLLVASLHVAGVIIGYHLSLANAHVFDPAHAQQDSLTGSFLSLLGVFLIFVTDLHHQMLSALADSYALFVPGAPPPVADFAETAARMLAGSFGVGLRIAAPFVIVGLVFYIGLGLLSRLMPQIQVFFIAIPLQLLLGFVVLALVLSTGLGFFLETFAAGLAMFEPGG